MGFSVHLDIEVTCRAAAVANLALACHADAHPVADSWGNIDHQVAAAQAASVSVAVVARIFDDVAVALAGGAWA